MSIHLDDVRPPMGVWVWWWLPSQGGLAGVIHLMELINN